SSPTTTPPSCGTLIQCGSPSSGRSIARPKPSAPRTAPGWMRTRRPSRTRVTRVTRATSTEPAPTTQSSPITQPGPIVAPASTRLPGPMLLNGPTLAVGSTLAPGSTCAAGWIPGSGTEDGSNSEAILANATYGSRASRAVPLKPSASAGRMTTAEAPVAASWPRYLGLARNDSWPGAAWARVPTPLISTPGSPWTCRPKRSASPATAWRGPLTAIARPSERAAEGELQPLELVAFLLLERVGIADRDRSHRRAPHQCHASGGTQLPGVPTVDVAVHVAEVDEGRHARRRTLDQRREDHLDRTDGLQRATDRLQVAAAQRRLARTQGVVLEAAHRTRAASVEVLEERQAVSGDGLDVVGRVQLAGLARIRTGHEDRRGARVVVVVLVAAWRVAQVAGERVAVAVAVAQLGAGVEHEMPVERPELRPVVVDLVELDGGARQRGFQPDPLQGAAGRGQRAVEGVARPADLAAPGVERAL